MGGKAEIVAHLHWSNMSPKQEQGGQFERKFKAVVEETLPRWKVSAAEAVEYVKYVILVRLQIGEITLQPAANSSPSICIRDSCKKTSSRYVGHEETDHAHLFALSHT